MFCFFYIKKGFLFYMLALEYIHKRYVYMSLAKCIRFAYPV